MSSQGENLRRVSGRIAALVAEFVNARVGQEWHAEELRQYVAEREPGAPGSADRILRDLRQRGRISYELVSRSQSRYRTTESEVRT